MYEKYYTVDQLSQMLSMHPKTIQRYIREGKLKAIKLGKSWRISGHDLSRFTETNRTVAGKRSADDIAQVRVKASAVIDIEVCGKDDADRIINSLTAAMNVKPPEYGQASLHAQFLESDNTVRFTLWGNIQFMSAIINAIEVFAQEREEAK